MARRSTPPTLGDALTAALGSLGRHVYELFCFTPKAGFVQSEIIPDNLNSFWIRTLVSKKHKYLPQTI